jgi:hypothetical protein
MDLARSDTELHVFAAPRGSWWGRLLHAFDGRAFEARRPRTRPFWRSVTLGPRKARCLVNLSGVRAAGRPALDPGHASGRPTALPLHFGRSLGIALLLRGAVGAGVPEAGGLRLKDAR